jgi:hypothetical protein
MAFEDNLEIYRQGIEDSFGAIPEADVLTNSNTYRLVKLLTWARLAERDIGTGGGGGGGTTGGLTRSELASELENIEQGLGELLTGVLFETKQDEVIAKLQDIINGLGSSTPLESSLNTSLPIEVDYALTDTSLTLLQNPGFNLIRRITFSVSEPCKVELFREGTRIAVFLNARSVDMQFDDWLPQGVGIDVVVTQATGTVNISGYALVNNITLVNDVFSGVV